MGFDLEQHLGMDPHVEIGREELELGLPPSEVYDALSDLQDSSHKVSTPLVYGTGNSRLLGAGSNGSIRAPSASATDLQQAEMVPAPFDPGSHADLMSWPQLSMCESSMNGTGGQEDLGTVFNLNLRLDEVLEGETDTFRPPSDNVGASYPILPLEVLTEYTLDASKEPSPQNTRHGKDSQICNESERVQHPGEVVASAGKPGNDSHDISWEREVREPLSVDGPMVIPELTSVYRENTNCERAADLEYAGPAVATQPQLSECDDPDIGSGGMPTSFSGLFQSMLASDIPSSQVVEAGTQSSGSAGARATVFSAKNQTLTNLVNTTTKLMLASLEQPPFRPCSLQVENALSSRNRMKPKTTVLALKALPRCPSPQSASETSYRAARVASAATTASAAASAAKSAVQAAEASIEALASLGINNGSLYQGRSSFMNPRPLKVACGSTPVAAGVKRTFQDQRSPVVERSGGMNSTGALDLIKVGSTVEVMPADDGLQCGWFIAKVLSMTAKQALVVYDELMTDDGCSHLEESFPVLCSREEDSFGTTVLGAQGWIRPVHPFSSSQKRCHDITVCEKWVVGERVDAFVEDGWWEAIIEDLNEADETNITVFFPGDGSTTAVRAWNVRPSLVWKKGEWRPCRGDVTDQAYPPSKLQKTSSSRGKVERDRTKTKVAATPLPLLKEVPEPLAISQSLRSGASNDNTGMVIYSKERHGGPSLVTTTRELRSATRSKGDIAQTKVPVKSRTAPVSKTRAAKARASLNGSSPLASSQRLEVSVVPELEWDVRRQSARLQQKVVSPNPQDFVRGKTLSSRLSKKEARESAKAPLGRKAPSRRSQHKEVKKTPVKNDLAIVLLPETRLRTRSQLLAAKKG